MFPESLFSLSLSLSLSLSRARARALSLLLSVGLVHVARGAERDLAVNAIGRRLPRKWMFEGIQVARQRCV